MQSLVINADDLLTALRERSPQISSWLDRETGDIYQISALFGDDEVEDDPAFAEAMQRTPARFVRLPTYPASLGFAAMRAFVASLADGHAQAVLTAALARQRAFFHFRDALSHWPALEQQWTQQNRTLMLAWADGWLRTQGIAPQW